jgi:hypothetical protein
MSDPTPYTVSYSFGDFQANSPSSPLPATQVDNELANIAVAIATIVQAVKDVRRSDGSLENGVVTFESLALGLQLTFDPTNGQLVAAAVAGAQASATAANSSAIAAAISAAAATVQAANAAASASSVNLALFLTKAGNLAGLGSPATSRANLGLGSVATFDVGAAANNIVQLDGSAKIPAYDGSQITNIDVLPVGAMVWSTSVFALPGTLKANGALLSRASFPRLWSFASASGTITTEAGWSSAASGAYSSGDLATTFRLPDLRGEFIRGFDDGRGVDPGRLQGHNQAADNAPHTHAVTGGIYGGNGSLAGVGTGATIALINATAVAISSQGGEGRPRNVPLVACIKY